ncbi:hypothetical protein AUK10_00375 [Candidatus Gracilibacteria bacterium CG2_30_37_12]|nr:MAG: hypothetical protein AUK10_00375 [Candidatus Gracilibacteria bacterium CG2_30_37_12]
MKDSFINLRSGLLAIQSIGETDRNGWESCWDKYTEGDVDSETTEITWNRLNNSNSAFLLYGLIAKTEDSVLGILHAKLEYGTFSAKPRLYVEDLFVDFGVQRGVLLQSRNSNTLDIITFFKFAVTELVRKLNINVSEIRFDTENSNIIARRTYEKRLNVGQGELNQKRFYTINEKRIGDEIRGLDDMVSKGKILMI